MRLRRYTAPSIKEALEKVRAEMGDGALIIETRRVRPWWRRWGKASVEVVAALDGPSPPERPRTASPTLADRPARGPAPAPEAPRVAQPPPRLQVREDGTRRAEWFERLVDSDVEASLAWEIVQRAELLARATGRTMSEAVATQVAASVPTMPLWERKGRPLFVMMVGPTGTGKTTTLAKLAANFALVGGWRVALVTTDTFRIGAIQQLRTYADLVGLPLQVANDVKELQAATAAATHDLVLIDTAGHNPGDAERLARTEALARALPAHAVILLVVPAGMRQGDLRELVAAYRSIPIGGIVVTKVDETRCRGVLLNAPRWAQAPLAYIATGQMVPDDIELADGEAVARWLLGSGRRSEPVAEGGAAS
ncbi:MAG TPA: hypothetical protein VIK73_10995 [Limnochordales bacterium]